MRSTRTRALLLAWLIAVLFALVGWATPANAVQDPGWPTGDVLGICPGELPQTVQEASQEFLPINRWGGLVQMHTRLSWNPMSGDWGSKIQRTGIITGALSAGNGAWSAASGLVENANAFCVGSQIVQTVDHTVGELGKSMFDSGIITLLVVITLIAFFWQARKRGAQAGDWARIGLTLGVLAMLVFGAMKSSTDPPSLGKGSPAWWSVRINLAISNVSYVPARALNDLAVAQADAAGDDADGVSCATYRANLRKKYVAALEAAGGKYLGAVQSSISQIWTDSGLRAWTGAQFGTENDWGDLVGCHLLDHYRQVPAEQQIELTGLPEGATNKDAFIWKPADNDQVDRAAVAWAACTYTDSKWQLRPEWKDVAENKDDESCSDAFTRGDYDGDGGVLDWDSDEGEIREKTAGQPEVTNFLLNLQGRDNGAAMSVSTIYALAAFIGLAVYALFAGAIFIAKCFMLFLGFWAIFVLMRALLPGSDSAVAKVARQYIGIALFVFGAGLILSFIAIITSSLIAAGTPGEGVTTWSMIWAALSPVAALVLVHQLFKRVLQAPSPFTPGAAMKWGAAFAGGGALAGVGLDRAFNRGMHRGRTMGRRVGELSMDSLLGRRRPRIGGLGQAALAGAVGGAATAGALDRDKDDQQPQDAPQDPQDTRDTQDAPDPQDAPEQDTTAGEPTDERTADDDVPPVLPKNTRLDEKGEPYETEDPSPYAADNDAPSVLPKNTRLDENGEPYETEDPSPYETEDLSPYAGDDTAPIPVGQRGPGDADPLPAPTPATGGEGEGDDADPFAALGPAGTVAATAGGAAAAADPRVAAEQRTRRSGRDAARAQREARSRVAGTPEWRAEQRRRARKAEDPARRQREANAYAARGNRSSTASSPVQRAVEHAGMRVAFLPHRAAGAAATTGREAWEAFTEAPLRKTAKVAGVGLAVAAAPVAFAPAAAAVGTVWALRRASERQQEDPGRYARIDEANLRLLTEHEETRRRTMEFVQDQVADQAPAVDGPDEPVPVPVIDVRTPYTPIPPVDPYTGIPFQPGPEPPLEPPVNPYTGIPFQPGPEPPPEPADNQRPVDAPPQHPMPPGQAPPTPGQIPPPPPAAPDAQIPPSQTPPPALPGARTVAGTPVTPVPAPPPDRGAGPTALPPTTSGPNVLPPTPAPVPAPTPAGQVPPTDLPASPTTTGGPVPAPDVPGRKQPVRQLPSAAYPTTPTPVAPQPVAPPAPIPQRPATDTPAPAIPVERSTSQPAPPALDPRQPAPPTPAIQPPVHPITAASSPERPLPQPGHATPPPRPGPERPVTQPAVQRPAAPPPSFQPAAPVSHQPAVQPTAPVSPQPAAHSLAPAAPAQAAPPADRVAPPPVTQPSVAQPAVQPVAPASAAPPPVAQPAVQPVAPASEPPRPSAQPSVAQPAVQPAAPVAPRPAVQPVAQPPATTPVVASPPFGDDRDVRPDPLTPPVDPATGRDGTDPLTPPVDPATGPDGTDPHTSVKDEPAQAGSEEEER